MASVSSASPSVPALEAGDIAPDFTLPATGGGTVSLSALRGKKVVVYFYPKDDTPGCTQESCEFRDSFARLAARGVAVIGISRDSVASHEKFREKYALNFPLASDEKGEVTEKYGVWVEKSMYGKKYMGIDRATFLIGEDGKILRLWRKVKVGGHVDDVIAAAEG